VSQKTSEVGVKKLSCLSEERASLDGFSQLNASFSSEAGEVLTFFASFFVSRQKMKSGFRGETPIGFIYLENAYKIKSTNGG